MSRFIEPYRTPFDDEPPVSELQDTILGLLEDAEIDSETNDTIMKLLDAAERKKFNAGDPS